MDLVIEKEPGLLNALLINVIEKLQTFPAVFGICVIKIV